MTKIIMKNTSLSIVAGILLSISLPNFYIPFAFIIGFFILFQLTAENSYKYTLFYSFITGFSFALFSYYWIIKAINYYGGVNIFVSILLLILFSFFYSILYFVSFSLILKGFINRFGLIAIFLAPFLWVLIEISREYFPYSGFPWNLAGYMISYMHPIENLASYIGIYGLSFIVILISSLIFYSIKRKNIIYFALAVIIFIVPYTFFSFYKKSFYGKSYKIAILQGNIEEDIKQNDKKYSDYILNVYLNLFKKAVKQNPDLIILPESAVPFFYFSESEIKDKFFKEIKPYKIPFLIGLDNFMYINDKLLLFNSLFLFDENHNLVDFYNKIKLVPFGEYTPFPFKLFSSLFPYLEGYDFKSGERMNILNYKDFKFIPLICFEAIFPNFVSDFAKKGNIIVNVSNDAWFGKTSAPFQHLEMARIRAVETGRFLIRATNTGISAVILPDGTVEKKLPLFKRDILIADVKLLSENTFWIKYKNILFILFIILFIGYISFLIKRSS